MNKRSIIGTGYAVRAAMADLKRGWKLNLVLAFSLALGMLLPMLCLGNINVFVQKYSTAQLQDGAHTLTIAFSGGYASPGKIEKALKEQEVTFDRIAFSAYTRCQVEWENISNQLYVYYVTENLYGTETATVLEGSLQLSTDVNMCLVDESALEKYVGLSVGDTVDIAGIPFKVTGIVSALDHKSVVVPLSSEKWDSVIGLTLSDVYIHAADGLPETDLVEIALEKAGLTDFKLQDGEQTYRKTLMTGLQRSAVILFVGVVAFCFAAINISLILTGKLMQDKRVVGIRMALGASPGQILVSMLTEHFLCYCVAYLLDIGLVRCLQPTYPEELELAMDGRVYAVSFLFGMAMVLTVTLVSARWLRKQSLVTLMERTS